MAAPGAVAALSDEIFANTWDNREDAVYDRWGKIYGIRKPQCGGVKPEPDSRPSHRGSEER